MYIYIFLYKPFEETSENAQWRKVKQMQPMWLRVFSCKQFEEAFENAQWKKVKEIMKLCLFSGGQFVDILKTKNIMEQRERWKNHQWWFYVCMWSRKMWNDVFFSTEVLAYNFQRSLGKNNFKDVCMCKASTIIDVFLFCFFFRTFPKVKHGVIMHFYSILSQNLEIH